MKDKNVVFMGTPDIAVPILEMLIELTNVCLVVTKPDAYKGRKKELTISPVKEVAIKNNIPVFTPKPNDAYISLYLSKADSSIFNPLSYW